MRIQLTTLVAVLCFQIPAFSMFDCDCSWEIDMVCIQTEEGTIVPFPNACWAECMGYEEESFVDCSYDINYDPTCGCSFLPDPVCVAANTGEIVLFPNSCWAECVGYGAESYLDCNYDLPTNPNCGCDFTLDEVCVEVDEDVFMPFPNACWANCMGYTEAQFVDCDEVDVEELIEIAEEYYNLVVGESNNGGNLNEEESPQVDGLPDGTDLRQTEDNHNNLIKENYIFPNPSSNHVYVKLNLEEAIRMRIDIVSLEGKTYQSINYKAAKGSQVINIDTRDLPSGIYVLQIYAGKESQSIKFVKR